MQFFSCFFLIFLVTLPVELFFWWFGFWLFFLLFAKIRFLCSTRGHKSSEEETEQHWKTASRSNTVRITNHWFAN